MYQNIYYDHFNKEIHLWDDEIGYNRFNYTPYAYKLDSNGKYVNMNGDRVSKVLTYPRRDLIDSDEYFEFDLKPEMRTLIDLYYDESDEVSKGHCITCLDIEVAREGKHSPPREAKNTITSISYWDSISEEFVCLILDKEGKINPLTFTSNVKVYVYSNERDLLKDFITKWNEIPTTIVTGWNVLWYDIEYLYNRLERLLGKTYCRWLSPIQKVSYFENYRGEQELKIAGISILDYMELYKTLTYKEQSSYTLDNICKIELDRGKVEYEKDLDYLYKNDPVKFIEYNVEDVRLVIDLDKKLDYIAIAQGTCHKGRVPYEDIFKTSRYMTGACLTETKKRGIVAIKSNIGGGEKAKGAFVKKSRPGRYQWVYDLDLTSLYPSNIMSLNISPETKWGKIENWDSEEFVCNEPKTYKISVSKKNAFLYGTTFEEPHDKIKDYLRENNLSVSANGILYSLDEVGLIPSLLDRWFSERAEYRSLSTKHFDDGDMEKHQYYERKQIIQKVLLNSLYGVLLLPIFRFYDRDNGEAVTLTGQQLIQYTTKMANYFYNKELNNNNIIKIILEDNSIIEFKTDELVVIVRENEEMIIPSKNLVNTDVYIRKHE